MLAFNMGSRIHLQETLSVGEAAVSKSDSPANSFGVVFEDDGQTAYFYATDNVRTDQPILNAKHIYNVDSVDDRYKPSTLQVAWSDDGLKAVVVINRFPHAVYDFEARRGYCRTNFPKPDKGWTGHAWDDPAISLFR